MKKLVCILLGLIAILCAEDIKSLERNCNNGNAESCYDLGALYANGFGVNQDFKQAKKLFGKACDLGDQFGCNNYANINNMNIKQL